ncbi:MAG: acyl-CoA dehydrogenase family protein [Oceanicaulis sp.]
MIDLSLSEDQRMLQRTARDFAERVVAPFADRAAQRADDDPQTDAEIRAVLSEGAGLGFTALLVPESEGGLARPVIDLALLLEELGRADITVAADLFNLTATMAQLVVMAGAPDQKRDLLSPLARGEPMLFSGALSEAGVAGSDLFCPEPDPAMGVKTRARRDGRDYVLSGAKSAFVTNAGAADHYFVMARLDPERPAAETLTIFVVPKDAAGLSFGANTRLIGWKGSRHAEVYLDDVRLPETARLGGEGDAMRLFGSAAAMPVGLAACFVGLARAAYEDALAYARERRSWGKPIIEHQAVALKLADMRVRLDAARLLVWDAALACDADPMAAATLKAPAAKSAAVDAAIANAQACVEIHGAYGVTREYRAGRYLNDAWVGYACDFTRDMLRLSMTPFL